MKVPQFARSEDWLSIHARRSQPLPMDCIVDMRTNNFSSMNDTMRAPEETTSRFASVSFVHSKEHHLEGTYAFPHSQHKCRTFPYPSWAHDKSFLIPLKDSEVWEGSRYPLRSNVRSLRITTAESLWEWCYDVRRLTSLRHVRIRSSPLDSRNI